MNNYHPGLTHEYKLVPLLNLRLVHLGDKCQLLWPYTMILAPLHAEIRESDYIFPMKKSIRMTQSENVFPDPALSAEISSCSEESLPVSPQKV